MSLFSMQIVIKRLLYHYNTLIKESDKKTVDLCLQTTLIRQICWRQIFADMQKIHIKFEN